MLKKMKSLLSAFAKSRQRLPSILFGQPPKYCATAVRQLRPAITARHRVAETHENAVQNRRLKKVMMSTSNVHEFVFCKANKSTFGEAIEARQNRRKRHSMFHFVAAPFVLVVIIVHRRGSLTVAMRALGLTVRRNNRRFVVKAEH